MSKFELTTAVKFINWIEKAIGNTGWIESFPCYLVMDYKEGCPVGTGIELLEILLKYSKYIEEAGLGWEFGLLHGDPYIRIWRGECPCLMEPTKPADTISWLAGYKSGMKDASAILKN